MRSGQQNKRGRGRNNNGRKNGNPLSRTYDSTGPDVKIRGTAQHIADKYATMARDVLGAGDTVMAENYLQHAEHYNRIIAAAQAQMQERYQREEREREQQPSEPAEATVVPIETETTEPVVDGTGPRPVISGTPAEIAIEEENAQQPTRRQPIRPRAAASKDTPSTATDDGNATGTTEKRSAAGDAQETVPKVAAAATDA